MNWRDAGRLAWSGVGRRLGRSVLTIFSVALAAALLTALLAVAGTARTRVLAQLTRGGPLAGIRVDPAAPNFSELQSDDPTPGAPRAITTGAVARIAGLPEVASVLPVVSVPELVLPTAAGTSSAANDPDPRPFADELVGVSVRDPAVLPVSLVAGRLPAAGSLREVCVTEAYLSRLHIPTAQANRVVGTHIALAAPRVFPGLAVDPDRGLWVKPEIVGVVVQDAGTGAILGSVQLARRQLAFVQQGPDPGGSFSIPESTYSGLLVVAKGLNQIGPARTAIADIGYSTSAPQRLIQSVLRYLHVVEIVLSGIGLIALLIAALGICGAMLAAVRERRREIGVLKAIGARDRDVRRVFLVEAGLIGLIGGTVGTVAGSAMALILGGAVNRYLTQQGLAGVRVSVPVLLLLAGVLGSTVLALVAGVLPAQLAARLPAREAVAEG
jgi:hypothetical protein